MTIKSALNGICCAWLLARPPALAAQSRIPAGTPIAFRIGESVSSDTSMAGHAFHAVVIAPVYVGERLTIAPGT